MNHCGVAHRSTSSSGDQPMIGRALLPVIEQSLERDGCVLLVGPYEVGKSVLAHEIVERFGDNAHFLNARDERDRLKLDGEAGLIRNCAGKLVVIDEIHCFPDVLDLMHSEIEAARDMRRQIGRFLVLGSSSLDAEQLVAKKLGTRADVFRLSPIDVSELPQQILPKRGDTRTYQADELEATSPIERANNHISLETLWLRGGFPKSLLADNDEASFHWRQRYLESLCARGYAHLNSALSASSIQDFLDRIATLQGATLNENDLPVAQRPCLDHFDSLGLIRRLRPWFTNEGKRLKKNPKVYIKDSGLLHSLLRKRSHDELRANDGVYGQSWEGFCIENLIAAAGSSAQPYFFRNDNQEEIDLLLEFSTDDKWAIEMKAGDGAVSDGFYKAVGQTGAVERIVVRNVRESYDEKFYSVKTLFDAVNMVRNRAELKRQV